MKTNGKNSKSMRFGGPWTKEKLEVLEKYLRAYTTALKKQGFKLMYIDAFAGSGGFLEKHSRNARSFILGSTQRSIKIDKKPFDKLIFVEIDPNRCNELENLRKEHPGRNIEVINSEANKFLSKLNEDWCRWRGVLFLDQFSTEVEWSTVEKIASFEALDTWILFPHQQSRECFHYQRGRMILSPNGRNGSLRCMVTKVGGIYTKKFAK